MPELSLRDKPSIAVLPFANLNGDPQQDYFSDGITEDISTELSRFSELLVSGRSAGSWAHATCWKAASGGAATASALRRSIIDAVTGAHRWAERYERELHDAFAVQDEVARAIVALLAAHVNRAEIERTLLKPPAAWEAYEYYLRGAEAYFSHLTRRSKASFYEARRLLE